MHLAAISWAWQGWLSERNSRGSGWLMEAPPDEPPLRAELFSLEQLEQHAQLVAATHTLSMARRRERLLPRLAENEKILCATYDLITAAAEQSHPIEPASEWLLDNFYLIEEQIRSIRQLLPPSFSRNLPRLANGISDQFPRVYGIALELIIHVDGRIDAPSLNGFVASYQKVVSLKLGELWALPLMLRLALVENLRRVAVRISEARRHRDSAISWAQRMIETAANRPLDLVLVLADLARANLPLTGAFLAELNRRLQGQNLNFSIVNSWIEHRLEDQGLTTQQLVASDGQAQAADQVSVGNSINSLRFLNSYDWRQFVADHSQVEHLLAHEPADCYSKMDFATRNRYRHAVEAIARRSKRPERDVAAAAVQLAAEQFEQQPGDRTAHVGYYLVDRGRSKLERATGMRLSATVVLDRTWRHFPLTVYLTITGLVTLAATFLFILLSQPNELGWIAWTLLAVPVLFSAANLGFAIANGFFTQRLSPQALPRLDFEKGIPVEQQTLVAIPTMLTSAGGIEKLLERIEIHYLANRDSALHFALITDFVDAATETTSRDSDLIEQARQGITALNVKYAPIRADIFYLLHRSRRWNAQEGVWMGYERKRGKLADLNATLRGATDRFSEVVGDVQKLQSVRYVITLDTDTMMPRDAARSMVGTIAHPLNRPCFDAKKRRVVDGYTILQPRVDISLPTSNRTRFRLVHSGLTGIDPYTRVVSDLYQDLFAEGSYIGKGIYDVDSFERCCNDFPENTILSHDLIEGAGGRSGRISDVTLYEDYPAHYASDVARRHRWIRGDWQIAGWILPWVRNRSNQLVRSRLTSLSRWKIFDNLRRSLSPLATLVLLMISWSISTATAVSGTLLVVAALFLPTLLASVLEFFKKPIALPWQLHLWTILQSLGKPLTQNLLTAVYLPFEAYCNLDAILRSQWRMLVSRRKMLEWKTASENERNSHGKLIGTVAAMIVAPAVAAISGITLSFLRPDVFWIASPWLVAWFIAPLVTWWFDQEVPVRRSRVTTEQHLFLERLSRRTWRYFEEFVTAKENWLPPDNVHQNPERLIAPRTSPTNIGMGLLAEMAAVDFGYSSLGNFLYRVQNTLTTLSRLERFQGHFFNWYDTRTLLPMYPRYVSTVDSGNLVGSFLVLASGCLEKSESSVVPRRLLSGLRDTLRVLLEVAGTQQEPKVSTDLIRTIEHLIEQLNHDSLTLPQAYLHLKHLTSESIDLAANVPLNGEFSWWLTAYQRTCEQHLADICHLAPWLPLTHESQIPIPFAALGVGSHAPAFDRLLQRLNCPADLKDLNASAQQFMSLMDESLEGGKQPTESWWSPWREAMKLTSERASERLQTLERIAQQCRELSYCDFGLLYDSNRELFAIGYNDSERRVDTMFYDLLASETRLVSYILVAQGAVGQEHWFALGRLLTSTGHAPALLSWSGSMFEYLMPLLVMPNYENTLLDRTYSAVVRRQIQYGRQRGVPWGISESGYNQVDHQQTYQYRAFGVPGLGLKRGLAEDLVIAPYASVLALMIAPRAACDNLQRLAVDGQLGEYGFYEAVDYTPSRLPPGSTSSTVRQFMAHHQGMSFLALAYLLLDQPMQRRFLADPMLRASELLLQERIPKATAPVFPHAAEVKSAVAVLPDEQGVMRVFTDPNSPNVEAHLLSNGRYHVAVTSAGGGYSRWRELAVTRWREDATRDNYGSFCYLRDVTSGKMWSTSWQPTARTCQGYEAIFTQSRAEFRRTDHKIETYTQISVSPEDDIELRRVTLTNRSETPRTIEITSYSEVVLATQAQDKSHPAFSNLFVTTEIIPNRNAIYCTRRPRSVEETPPWMTHLMTVRGTTVGETSFETDRMRFVGRHRTLAFPAALSSRTPLSNTSGPTLDPIVSIRQSVVLPPNGSIQIDIVTGIAESRADVVSLTEKYCDHNLTDRVFDVAWTHGHVQLQQLGITEAEGQVYGRLSSSIIYASALRRARTNLLGCNRRGQSSLWSYGISGDTPIVLLRISSLDRMTVVDQLLRAHSYWRLKGLTVDLVIWNEDDSVYRQEFQEAIAELVAASPAATLVDRPGGIFIRRSELMSEEDRALLQSVARIVLVDEGLTLAEHADRLGRSEVILPLLVTPRRTPEAPMPDAPPKPDLAFFNGLGGFSHDGREYITILRPGQTTPAPWVNVIANPQFGTVISEGGSSYTWAENSHEYRLTPWHNDPVSDVGGEAMYLRDEESGRFWSPSPLPARGQNTYVSRHGFGYSIFDYTEEGINTELCVYVAIDAPVKFYKLKLINRSGRKRKLSATAFWELVLGESRNKTLMHVVTETDASSGAILARNAYHPDFGDRVAFFNCSESNRTITGDRCEFLGRNGSLQNPAALRRVRLSGRTGAGFDPGVAMQTAFVLEAGQERTITFTVGAESNADEARRLAQRFRNVDSAHRVIESVWDFWSRTLGTIHVQTPDAAVNFLANGWLVYQTMACRLWGRTGFYQSGGAFGFRDQLQDAMALVDVQPHLLREHLLRAAGHQFSEGDVQHWWHPPQGRGVRTHFSDDYLWLPVAICHYVSRTGDTGVLNETIPFLRSRPLRAEEESVYDLPQVSEDIGTLYEHGVRAIERGLRFGEHGLPLMGCGDWNDAMNMVGQQGRGESVWLAFFLFFALEEFSELAQSRGDLPLADRLAVEAGRLRGNIEVHGWDGQWYRRAYFDDGRPLGSASNEECQIDSISQSWSVLSGAGTLEHMATAMESVNQRLVKRKDRLILLLDPPFDKSDLNPGYIKGYLPGVRENGGQYTHGAIWTAMATAKLGEHERAWELFSLINPINHTSTPDDLATYRVEPYVVAADVYGVPPHCGRGGWTWYTGSAGWMYRLIVESLLGLTLKVDQLQLEPRLPQSWSELKIHYRYRNTFYHLEIHNQGVNSQVSKLTLDGIEIGGCLLPLTDDGQHHHVMVELKPK